MLDNTRLTSELTHIHRILSAVAATPRGRGLLDELRRTVGGSTAALLRQALFADCLRVTCSAVAADGRVHDEEIEATYEPLFSMARHYAAVLPERYGDFSAIEPEAAHRFLKCYTDDRGPFGRGSAQHWPGLTLCRRAAELGEAQALERYEAMMSWLITEACHIGGVAEGAPRWRGRVDELVDLRRELARDVHAPRSDKDLRLEAFLAPTRVFAAVQQASSIYEDDPFDVESIHADARACFEDLVDRATTPGKFSDSGRTLLVLGDSGAGKTHVLRGFRKYVHERNRGFVVYAQLHSASEDYARYLLQHVVDSLARPYTGPSGERTGLRELASGLINLAGEGLKGQLERLLVDDWESSAGLAEHIDRIVDGLLKEHALSTFDPDLLRVMLYALLPDQSIASRVYKYLRCEEMNSNDRRKIGDVTPRTEPNAPYRMIIALGKLAHISGHATLVLMIDQAERAGYDASTGAAFRKAAEALISITSELPSAIAVIACLDDLYKAVRGQLSKYVLDRLENDPPIERLLINRSYPEIEAIVSRRLSWMYAAAGAAYRPETPVYPIPADRLRALVNRRTRDVLEWCHRFQAQCAAAGGLVREHGEDDLVPPVNPDADLDQIAEAWNDAIHASGIEVPDDEEQLLEVMMVAARACAEECMLTLGSVSRKNETIRFRLDSDKDRVELALAITNKSYQRGSFAAQLESLRRSAGNGVPVAVRTLEFPMGQACERALGQHHKAGGQRVVVDASALRTLVALQSFKPPFPEARVAAWRRRDRPISSLSAMSAMLSLELLRPAASPEPPQAQPEAQATAPATAPTTAPSTAPTDQVRPRGSSPRLRAASSEPSSGPVQTGVAPRPPREGLLQLGTTADLRQEPCDLPPSALHRPSVILSSAAVGATELAQRVIEQALERGVAVVIMDRKGELAGYGRPAWWQDSADPARARQLADKLEVRLFTPGLRGGRGLRLRVVPDLRALASQPRDHAAQHAAAALAELLGMTDTPANAARRALLTTAVSVLAERPGHGTLAELITLIQSRDDAMIARHGRFDERTLKRLVEELEELLQGETELLDPSAAELTAELLLGGAPAGKVPLAILSTRHLGDTARAQALTTHVLGILARHAASAPTPELRTLLVLDEAELFLPLGALKPAAKAALQEVLKRSRPEGLGVLLLTQNPDDFDLRGREQLATWWLGKQPDRRMMERLRALLESHPEAASKVGALEAGHFVMLHQGAATEFVPAPSLLGKAPPRDEQHPSRRAERVSELRQL